MYGGKIKMIRELRGFSQEYMAGKLGIAQHSYSRLEKDQTKLTAELLDKLAKELGVSPVDILSSEPAIVNFGDIHGSLQQGNILNIYNYHKELLETLRTTLETVMEHNKLLMKYIEGRERKE